MESSFHENESLRHRTYVDGNVALVRRWGIAGEIKLGNRANVGRNAICVLKRDAHHSRRQVWDKPERVVVVGRSGRQTSVHHPSGRPHGFPRRNIAHCLRREVQYVKVPSRRSAVATHEDELIARCIESHGVNEEGDLRIEHNGPILEEGVELHDVVGVVLRDGTVHIGSYTILGGVRPQQAQAHSQQHRHRAKEHTSWIVDSFSGSDLCRSGICERMCKN